VNRQAYKLPDTLAASVQSSIKDWGASGKMRRLWEGDAALWTGSDEARGDFQVLAERGRRALRVHLSKDLKSGLGTLLQAFRQVLS